MAIARKKRERAESSEGKSARFSTQDERDSVIREIAEIQARATNLSIPKRIVEGAHQEVVAFKITLTVLEQDPFLQRLPRPRTTMGRLVEIRNRLRDCVQKVA